MVSLAITKRCILYVEFLKEALFLTLVLIKFKTAVKLLVYVAKNILAYRHIFVYSGGYRILLREGGGILTPPPIYVNGSMI